MTVVKQYVGGQWIEVAVGAQGPIGPTGPSGGPTGPTGPTGPSGGPTGPTGADGALNAVPLVGGTMTGDLNTTGLVITDTDGTGVIRLATQTTGPTGPTAGSSIIFTESVAGRPFPQYRGPLGDKRSLLQIPTDRLWAVHSNAGTIGCGTSVNSGTGTRTIVNNQIPRFTTAATANTGLILWMLNPRFNATLGFYGFLRVGYSDVSYNATGAGTGSRIWGLCGANTQSHPQGPRGVYSGVRRAFGFNREHVFGENVDTNWRIVSNHSDPVTVVDTEMPFASDKIYDQYLYRAPGDTNLYWRIDNYTDNTTASGVIAVGAAGGTEYAVQPVVLTIDAVARSYDIYSLYIEQERT